MSLLLGCAWDMGIIGKARYPCVVGLAPLGITVGKGFLKTLSLSTSEFYLLLTFCFSWKLNKDTVSTVCLLGVVTYGKNGPCGNCIWTGRTQYLRGSHSFGLTWNQWLLKLGKSLERILAAVPRGLLQEILAPVGHETPNAGRTIRAPHFLHWHSRNLGEELAVMAV